MLETAPKEARGGNSAFTGGAFRIVYHGLDDLARLIPDISDHELANVDFGTYTGEQYYDDMRPADRIPLRPRPDRNPDQRQLRARRVDARAGRALPAGLGRQAFKVDGKFKFWGGLACHIWGGGKELIKALHERARRAGITVLYDTPAVALLQGDGRRRRACACASRARIIDLRAKAVVLACGGFEANAEMRARYLGPGWDLAKVRGTRFNTGQGLSMALDLGAAAARPLVGRACRALGHERAAVRRPRCRRPLPEARLSVRHRRQRQRPALPRRGRRLPQLHLRQIRRRDPEAAGHVRLAGVRPEDRPPAARGIPHPAHHQGEGRHASRRWRRKLEGVDPKGFLETVRAFNAAPRPDVPFNPNIHDGLRTSGLAIDKSNWAQRLDTPPYEAYGVTTGITFTFGGLKITNERRGRGHHRPRRSPASTPPARSSAGSTTTTTPAAPA